MSADEDIATQVIPDATIPDPTVDSTPTPAPSLRDTIKAAVEVSKAPVEGETQEQKDQRVRDEGGRFAKGGQPKTGTLTLKDPKAKVETGTSPATATGADGLRVAGAEVAVAPSAKAPDGWKETAKAKFAALDPEVQAEIVRREKESHQKITSQDEDRTFGKKMRDLGRPYEATMAMVGANHETAFQDYLRTAHILYTGSPELKIQALRAIAQQHKIDLGTPLPQAPSDPNIAALMREVSELRQARQAEIQQRQNQENTVIKSAYDAFLAEPGIEHLDRVKPVMKALLESGAAETYRDAYDKAVYADPELRSTLLAAQQRETEEKRAAEAKAKADAAKRAAVSVTGGPGGVRPSTANGADGSLRDQIRANMRAAQGRI